MRVYVLGVLILIAGHYISAQTPTPSPQELPKDPRAILAAAQPLYDFNSADLKPWHLKASYQLYDDAGKPTEQGTFEYWWASPRVHRTTWTRPALTRSDWYTSDGKHAYQTAGAQLTFFERELSQSLLSPIPDSAALDPVRSRLQRKALALGDLKLACVVVMVPHDGQLQSASSGIFPIYCFDARMPVLRASYSFGTVEIQSIEFNNVALVQHRCIARNITMMEGRHIRLTTNLEGAKGIAADDPMLTPPSGAIVIPANKIVLEKDSKGSLIRKEVPVYPQDAKDARASGEVLLEATIGVDGVVRELHVIEAPWPSLAASAYKAVSHWQYRPYLVNGQPVEVQTTITVTYSID
jgi:TonB family protein